MLNYGNMHRKLLGRNFLERVTQYSHNIASLRFLSLVFCDITALSSFVTEWWVTKCACNLIIFFS